MAKTRLSLHEELCEVLGSNKCYFSPPNRIEAPCILYSKSSQYIRHADNFHYNKKDRWEITIIDTNPDSDIPNRFENHFIYFSKNREYATDGYYHFVYILYY